MIPLYRATITRKEMDSLLSNIIEGNIAPGEVEKEAVLQLVATLGWKQGYGSGVRSYLHAYQMAFEGLDLPEGSGVGVSPFTPVPVLSLLESMQLRPVLLPVDPRTLLVEPEAITQRLAAEEIGAVLLNSPLGNIPNREQYTFGTLPLVEDITWTVGGSLAEGAAGSVGTVVILSADHSGAVALGGGGFVVTQSMGVWRNIRKSSIFQEPSYRLPDLNSSLGCTQFKEIRHRIERKMNTYQLYQDALRKGGRHKGLLRAPEGAIIGPSFFPILLKGSVQDVRHYAKKKGIEIAPIFEESLYDRSLFSKEMAEHEAVLLRGIKVPLYPMLSRKEIDQISRFITTLP